MTSEQIKALIQMVATLAITIASIFGATLTDDQGTAIGICIVACIIVAYSVWRNANFTKAAGAAQGITDGLKDGTLAHEAVEAFLGTGTDGVSDDGK